MAYKSSPRGSRPVNKVAVHTAEGSRTAASLGAYFFRSDIQASSHVGIDGGNTLQYVGYDRAAWTLRSGNPISDNAELCGFARWTRDQWMSTGVVDGVTNPRAILDRTAAWIRSRCLARGIPIRKIGAADVAAGRSGVIGHYDWTIGARDGSHTDPGPNFPWDYVISKANNDAAGGGGGAPSPAPTPTPSGRLTVAQMEEYAMDPVIYGPTPVVKDGAGPGKDTQIEKGWQVVPPCGGQLIVQPIDDKMCFFGNPDPAAPVYCFGPGGGKGGGHSVVPSAQWQDGSERRATWNNAQAYEVPKGTTRVAYQLSSNGRTSVQFVPSYLLG